MLLSLLLLLPLSLASSGDRLPEFNDCVSTCVENSCPRDVGLLKLLAWDCSSDCDYACQQILTDSHELHHVRVHQYHGKWPFVRFFGMQEIASAVFSFLNLLPNYFGLRAVKHQNDSPGFHMRSYFIAFAYVGINTWLWSTVFHIRDLPITEKLDYFSAMGQILFGLFVSLVRLFRLDLPSQRSKRNLLIVLVGGFYASHVWYLSFVRFNYGYNMLAGVVIGLSQTAMWIYLGLRLYIRGNDRMDLLPVVIVLSVLLGMTFELNDFSPYWRIFDAHSLWHASTVIPTMLWYKWMTFDLKRHAKEAWNRKEDPDYRYAS